MNCNNKEEIQVLGSAIYSDDDAEQRTVDKKN